MSEAAPEAPPAARQGGNPFARRLGPLPVWAWGGVGVGAVLVYVMIRRNQAPSSAASPASGAAADVPQFVNQTYVSSTPPVPGPPSPPGPAGPGVRPWPVDIPPGKIPVPKPPVQYKVPARGKTPSLEEVARQFRTTPAAIVASSAGQGNPHGPAFLQYLARKDYSKPLPHGTNLDIVAG